METDLSLIEISGEDDSLLSPQQSPNGTVLVSNDRPYFACSPLLQIPRSNRSLDSRPHLLSSPTEITKGDDNISKPSFSSREDNSTNKENVNGNKPEVPKLSIQPHQMKRKKKGGGYNLRKSLAWDRAFFTEEGVLDPLELSMLSGDSLSVIHEGRESLSSELDRGSVSAGLQTLESNLFKELPSSAPEGRRVAGKMSPKVVSPAGDKIHSATAAKRKILSAHDINRGASKHSGCPLPVASSSLKRTSNANTMKVTTKDTRVSNPLAPKNEPSVVSRTSRISSSSAGNLQHNFTSRPVDARKEIGKTGTTTSTKNGPNDAKRGPPRKVIKKSTSLLPRRNVVKVSTELENHSSSNVVQPSQVSQANNSLEEPPDSVVSAAAHPLNGNDSNAKRNTFSLPQTACYSGGNMQQAQPQIAKPSGLRMPSPSLGFFGQSKPSDSHSGLKRGTRPCNLLESNIPSVKAGVLNPIHQRPPRRPRIAPPCSSVAQSVASTVNAASCGKIKSDLELSSSQEVALRQQFHFKGSDMKVNHKQQLQDADLNSMDHAEQSKKFEKISCIGNAELHINDSNLPVQSAPCERLEKDDGESAVDIFLKSKDSAYAGLDLPHCLSPHLSVEVESPPETMDTLAKSSIKIHGFSSESLTAAGNTNCEKTGSQANEDELSGKDEFKLSPQEAELKKHGTSTLDPMSDVESQNNTFFKDCKSSEKVINIAIAAYDILEVLDHPSQSTDVKPKEDETNGNDCSNKGEVQAGDAQTLSLDGIVSVGSCKSLINASAADSNGIIMDNPSAKSGEQTHILNSCLVTEQVFQDNSDPPSDGCLLSGKCSEESQEKNICQSVFSAESRTNNFGGESGSSIFLCAVSPVNQDYGFAASGKVKCLHLENASTVFVDNEPMDESFKHDVKLYGEAHASAMDKRGESSAIITYNVALKNFCSSSGDFIGSKPETPNVISQNSPVKQVEAASGMDNMIVHEGVTNKKPQNDACCSEKDIAMLHGDCFDAVHDVREDAAEQGTLHSHEAEQMNRHDEVCDDPCFDGNRPFENVSTIGKSGSEIPDSPLQCEIMENEPAAVDSTIEETLIGDAPVQSTDESLLADSYNSNISILMANKDNLLVVDNAMELVQTENEGLSSEENSLLSNTSVEFHGEDIENVPSAILEQHNDCRNESKSFDACFGLAEMVQDVNMDRSEAHLSVNPSFENVERYMDCDYRNDCELDNQSCSLKLALSSNSEENQIPMVAETSAFKSSCSSNEKTIDMSKESNQQDVQEDIPKSNILPSEGDFNVHQIDGNIPSELQDGLCSIIAYPEVAREATFSHNKSLNDNKEDSPAIQPPPNAVPFSDEWLAAIEAAGEEILASKSGAVQNSPPDKSLPEPGPWSPVSSTENSKSLSMNGLKYKNLFLPSLPESSKFPFHNIWSDI